MVIFTLQEPRGEQVGSEKQTPPPKKKLSMRSYFLSSWVSHGVKIEFRNCIFACQNFFLQKIYISIYQTFVLFGL